jgi:hypothetical protein
MGHMTKYRQIFMEMTTKHQAEFAAFKDIHDNYAKDPKAWKEKFDTEGAKILEIVKQYEDILTSKSDRGTYAKYSGNLSQKFHDLLKAFFPKIDFVGVKISS